MTLSTLGRLAGLDVRITGGSDREGGGSGPVVVLLHGFGAPGEDLVPLGRALKAPVGTRFVFPEAPIDLGRAYGNGRAWWRIDLERRIRLQAAGVMPDPAEVPDGLYTARAQVDALLGEVERTLGPAPGQLVLGGFSQGAMLSLDVGLHTTRPLSGLLLMSGTHIAANDWAARFAGRAGLPVFMSHGLADEILPFALADRLRETLAKGGLSVEWVPFRGGHGIPQDVVDRAGAFLERVLGDQEPA
jgi:phospholipase/carboxylesterase